VGLGGAPERPVGWHGVWVAGNAGVFGADPGGAGIVDGPGPSGGGHGRGDAPTGGHGAGVAHRSSGHGDPSRHRPGAGQVRAGGEALRGDRGSLPAEAGEPQGGGGMRGEVHVRAVVADHDSDEPRGGSAERGPVLGDDRRWPATPAGALRRGGQLGRRGPPGVAHDGRVGRHRSVDDASPGAVTGHHRRAPRVDDRASVAFRGNRYSVNRAWAVSS